MEKSFLIDGLDGYQELNSWLFDNLEKRSLLLLKGGLGAGKTTFLKQFCEKYLGVTDISSPTYALINMHEGQKNDTSIQIAHCDLYRLDQLEEALEVGIEDVIFDSDVVFVEWPEVILEILSDYTLLHFEAMTSGQRKVTVVYRE